MQEHQQFFEKIAAGVSGGGGGGGDGRIKNVSDQAAGSPEGVVAQSKEIESAVRSGAQKISQPNNLNRDQN